MCDDAIEHNAASSQFAVLRPRRRLHALLFACVTIPLFALFATSAGTWPRPDDAGELMTAAARLGIAHPTGYPLLTVLGKAATYIPIGTVAYRLNLLVAVFGATASGLLAVFVLVGTRNALAAALSGVAFGLAPTVWANSTNFEVYGLNALFIIACLLCATLAWQPDTETRYRSRWLSLLAVGVGLGISHHLSFAAVIPALAVIVWAGKQHWMPAGGDRFRATGLLLLGLTPWLYLPIRAWYFPDNPETCWTQLPTLRAVVSHMTAREYQDWLLTYSITGVPMLLQRYLDAIWQQFGPLLLLVPFGIVSIPRHFRGPAAALLAMLTINMVLFLGYVVEDYEVFYIPSYVAVAVAIGLGVRSIGARAARSRELPATIAMVLACTTILIVLGAGRWPQMRGQTPPFAFEYTQLLEQMLPSDAVVFVASQWSDPDSITFPLLYARQVEGRLPGVSIETARRLPGSLAVEVMGHAAADRMARELMQEIGMSKAAIAHVMERPARQRLRALVASYDGPRPLFTDSPALFEEAGFGLAYNGYYWRRLPEPGYALDAEPEAVLAWVTRQAARPEADQTLQDNLSLPLLNYMHYTALTSDAAHLAAVAAITADTCPRSQYALHAAIDHALDAGMPPLAWQMLRQLQAEYPYHADSYILEAQILLGAGRFSEALRAANRAAALSMKKREQITTMRALSYLGMGDTERARRVAGPILWPRVLAAAGSGAIPRSMPPHPIR